MKTLYEQSQKEILHLNLKILEVDKKLSDLTRQNQKVGDTLRKIQKLVSDT